ncbi:MAG: radical SAM/SPASM domain-containing protein [Nitrospirales bacterium]
MPHDLRFREFNPLKIWHHADRLQALAAGKDVAPVTVEVDPVSYCNHHCFWCVDPLHKRVTASRAFLWQLLEELAEFEVNGFGVHGIVFKGGGEPTLHPDFPDLMEKARMLGFEVGVVTNGSRLLKPGWAEALAQANYVRISIDGPTPETHQRIHGTNDFDQIVAGVEQLMSLRRQRHPIVGLSFAMDHAIKPVVPEAISLGDKLGVDYVLIRPPFFEEVGRSSTMTATQAVDLRQALIGAAQAYAGPMAVLVGNWIGDAERAADQVSTLSSSGRRTYQVESQLPIEHRLGKCWASPVLAVVAADGEVYGCCNLRYLNSWGFGRVDYENDVTFADLWGGMQRQQVFARMENTECISHCTHPLARYNEIIEVLRDQERPHSSFV